MRVFAMRDDWHPTVNMPDMGRSMAEKIVTVQSRLAHLGLAMTPGDRLSQLAALFTGPDGNMVTVKTTSPEFRAVLEASREFALLEYTLNNWPFDPADARATVKLKQSLKDPLLDWNLAHPARGRSLQLELFVASMCHRAGFRPVKLSEPDVLCPVRDRPFGVAVKRAQSQTDVPDLIRDGAAQVQTTGDRGVVFIDMSCGFNQRYGFVTRPMTDVECDQLHVAWMRKCIEPLHVQLKKAVRGSGTLAVYVWSSFLRFAPASGWQPETLLMDVDTSRENRSHKRLYAAFRAALSDAHPSEKYA